MTGEDWLLLRRKWVYANRAKILTAGLGRIEGFTVLDLRKEGLIGFEDGEDSVYNVVGRSLEISSTVIPNNAIRLRICELTENNLTIAFSGKKGTENDGFSDEFVEMSYVPTADD